MSTPLKNKEDWLSDLVNGNMETDAMAKGFLKFYVLEGGRMEDMQRDIRRRFPSKEWYVETAVLQLRGALEEAVEAPDRSEMRTIDEVRAIVAAVRAGEKVRIEYYDLEADDEMVAGACW